MSDTVCLLYASCQTTKSCSVCTSGPVSPGWDQCMKEGNETLLMGGWTDPGGHHMASIELVTESLSCPANIPELPVGIQHAASTVMGDTILHCGGDNANAPQYRADCYTYTLGKLGAVWEEAPSMEHPRNGFTLESYKGKAYAIGGQSDYGVEVTGPTVEIINPGQGWNVDPTMQMPNYRDYHCSVMMDSRIIVIGGQYAGTAYSQSVIQFDLEAQQKS